MMTTPSRDNSSDAENKGELVQKLFKDIEVAAREKKFQHAEELRERLMQAGALDFCGALNQ